MIYGTVLKVKQWVASDDIIYPEACLYVPVYNMVTLGEIWQYIKEALFSLSFKLVHILTPICTNHLSYHRYSILIGCRSATSLAWLLYSYKFHRHYRDLQINCTGMVKFIFLIALDEEFSGIWGWISYRLIIVIFQGVTYSYKYFAQTCMYNTGSSCILIQRIL